MRKVLVCALIVFGSVLHSQAQEVRLGATAGFLNAKGSIKTQGLSISNSESGFYVGAVADFTISENFNIRPELLYANVNDAEGLILPVLGVFGISEKFNLQLGPQFVFSLEESVEDFSSVELGLAGGIGFDIDEDFFIEARYSFQLNNSYTGSEDFKVRANYLSVGVGYMIF